MTPQEAKSIVDSMKLEEGKGAAAMALVGTMILGGASLVGADANGDNARAHAATQKEYDSAKKVANPITDPVKFRKALAKAKKINESIDLYEGYALDNAKAAGAHRDMSFQAAADHNAEMNKTGGVKPNVHTVMIKSKLGMAWSTHPNKEAAEKHAEMLREGLGSDKTAFVKHYMFDENGKEIVHSKG
jgi:hypothetical protein